MARQQRRYAAGPNSRTMVVVCRRTSFVVITPQIAIGDRLRNLAREDSPCYSRAIVLQRLTRGASRDDNRLGSAQGRGISQFLRVRAEGGTATRRSYRHRSLLYPVSSTGSHLSGGRTRYTVLA